MTLTVNQKIKLKITRQLVVLGLVMGLVYILFYYWFREPSKYIVGAISGMVLGLLIAFYELVLFKRGAKKIRFIWLFLLRAIIYLVTIVLIISITAAIARTAWWNMSLGEVFRNPKYYREYLLQGDFSVAVAYSLFLAFSVNFVRMISRKMGQGVLVSYLSGTYYTPVHQARVVMFARLKDADSILTKLGPEKYFNFLNDVFYDYSIPIVSHRGIIYEYVEDLAVITWSVDKGLERGNAIKTYFEIREAIKMNSQEYMEKYGVVPDIRAALHIGSVVRSEIGEVRAQIVLHGDTMNTTARMLNYCLDEDQQIITSGPLLHMIELPDGISKEEIGLIGLKGKEEKMTLFRLKKSSDES
jgi:adenylate cyclase